MKKRILVVALATAGTTGSVLAQIPDLLNTLDAGSRSMGAGSAFGVTSADTYSILNNPAGIGFISNKSYAFSMRNMPRSTTQMFGDLASPTLTSKGTAGKNQLSHFGYTKLAAMLTTSGLEQVLPQEVFLTLLTKNRSRRRQTFTLLR
jgi:hypothetical protein